MNMVIEILFHVLDGTVRVKRERKPKRLKVTEKNLPVTREITPNY